MKTMILYILVLYFLHSGVAMFPGFGKLLPDVPNPKEFIPNPKDLIEKVPGPKEFFAKIPNPVNMLFQNKCIEDIGCFYTGPPFYHPINRPLSLTPTSELKTKFVLFTPTNPKEGEVIGCNITSIRNSSFDDKLPVKVLIHGYRSELGVDDIRFKIIEALLNHSDYNIILVDWTEHNGPPYPQAYANARAVGAQLANLLNLMTSNTNVRPGDIHIIGHSLGGQMSGWAGERITGLGRITGLDPAGPYFQDAANEARLDATDALFVDVIHTDGGENVVDGLGIGDPIGHMDFYPNGGLRQPGCSYTASSDSIGAAVVNATTKWLLNGCNHGRANEYFLESIDNSKCRFLATWCNSYVDFEKGDCLPQNSTMAEMGFHAQRISGLPQKSKFFLRTSGSSPFCIQNSVYLTA